MSNELIIIIIVGAIIAIGIGVWMRRSRTSSPSRSAPGSVPPVQTAKSPIDKEKKEMQGLPSRSQQYAPPPIPFPPQQAAPAPANAPASSPTLTGSTGGDLDDLRQAPEYLDDEYDVREEDAFGGMIQQETEESAAVLDDLIVMPPPRPSKPITQIETSPSPIIDEEPNIDDGIPDWLSTTDTREEMNELPDWLSSEIDINDKDEELPYWLREAMHPSPEPAEEVIDDVTVIPSPSPTFEDNPDFDSMSPEETMGWMESLAQRQGASEVDISKVDESVPNEKYIPYGWTEEKWDKHVARETANHERSKSKPEPKIEDEIDFDFDEGDKDIDPMDWLAGLANDKPSPPQADVTTAHFSAFYPPTAQVNQRYGLYVYAHAEDLTDVIERDVSRFLEELGGTVPQARVAKDSKSLAHGTKITVLPESDELEFEPDILTKRWEGDWKRYEFEFRPKEDLAGDTAFVRVSIMVMGFEIARIKFAIDIEEQQMSAMSIEPMMMNADTLPKNPLARAKLQHAVTSGYDKIFISYSRQDKLIAEAFKVMQEAAGHDVFLDVEDIRAGEDWQAALARAIDSADFIQLFWSQHSASSEFCRYEWDYALNYRCQTDLCAEFIRPVWWDDPFPQPPQELGHLNFKRLNMQILMRQDEA